MDWEPWLQNSAKPPSDTEDSKAEATEEQIREALTDYGPLEDRDYAVYVKGSYANNTNVRLDYDVDIAVEYRGFFYSKMAFDLKDEPESTNWRRRLR
jgi:tRNA nucleotidyltransferase (CCA-adding enzyme)